LVSHQFRFGFSAIPLWFLSNSALVSQQFRFGFSAIHRGCGGAPHFI